MSSSSMNWREYLNPMSWENEMDDLKFRQWCSKIPELTQDQIKTLMALLKRNGKTVSLDSSAKGTSMVGDWLYSGISYSLVRRGLLTQAMEKFGRKGVVFERYIKSSPIVVSDLENLITKQMGKKLSSVEKEIFGRIVGDCLINWCEKRSILPSRGSVLSNIGHCIEAIEESFPNYISSKMLSVVIDPKEVGDGKKVRSKV